MFDEMNARGKIDMQLYNDASSFASLNQIKLFILINIFILLDTNNHARMERTRHGFDRETWTRIEAPSRKRPMRVLP